MSKIEQSPRSYTWDLIFYAITPWLLAIGLWIYSPAIFNLALIGWVVLGWLVWSILEYVLHRFILHDWWPFRAFHEEHHRRPTALICLPTAISAGLILIFVLFPSLLFLKVGEAAPFAWGVFSGYAAYTWMHHVMHHTQIGGKYFRLHRFIHARHHAGTTQLQKKHVCYGVTTHFWDRIFKTMVD